MVYDYLMKEGYYYIYEAPSSGMDGFYRKFALMLYNDWSDRQVTPRLQLS